MHEKVVTKGNTMYIPRIEITCSVMKSWGIGRRHRIVAWPDLSKQETLKVNA